MDLPTQGSCDSGDCFYVNTVSWRNETTPNPPSRIRASCSSGCSATAAAPEARQSRCAASGSILDSVRAEASRVAISLGAGDRAKLGEYLDSVREVEQRIQHSEIAARGHRAAGAARRTFPSASTRTPS